MAAKTHEIIEIPENTEELNTETIIRRKPAKEKADNKKIIIKPLKIVKANFKIVGDSPLITHAWSEKAIKEIEDSQQGANTRDKRTKPKRDTYGEFMDSLYWLTPQPSERTKEAFLQACQNGAKFGFPTSAVKEAIIMGAYRSGQISNTSTMRVTFQINAREGILLGTPDEFGIIDYEEPPVFRMDPVKIGGMNKTTDLRYRAMFNKWAMRLRVTMCDTGIFDLDTFFTAVNYGGFMGGIGEWRIDKKGNFGHFHFEPDD